MKYKSILTGLLIWACGSILLADLPGGMNLYSGFFIVRDQNANAVSGVNVKLTVRTYDEYGEINICYRYGTTGSSGSVYLECLILPELSVSLYNIEGEITGGLGDYFLLGSKNTYSHLQSSINPVFRVTSAFVDINENGIHDENEMSLAQKFCPSLQLHSSSEWIAPEPVEYIGAVRDSLWVSVWNLNADKVGTFRVTDSFYPSVYSWSDWNQANPANFSQLTSNVIQRQIAPPGMNTGIFLTVFHFNYAGSSSSPTGWINYYEAERQQNNFPHTIYAHFFTDNGSPVIQYWFYYPYNDGYNNHEGDWEHINIILTNQDVEYSEIYKMNFYFHHKVRTVYSGYETYPSYSTHPKIYVGGECKSMCCYLSCEPGKTTGGSYPSAGNWYNVAEKGFDEKVLGNGPFIAYNNINIILIPDTDQIDYNLNPELSWLKANLRFGNMQADSPWDWAQHITPWGYPDDVGNSSVPSPAYNAGWNQVGPVGDAYKIY